MRRAPLLSSLALLSLLLHLAAPAAAQGARRGNSDERRIPLPPFGSGIAYVPRVATQHVIILVSGDDGLTMTMAEVARHLASDAIVISVSLPELTRRAAREGGCWYVASDFELMSHAAQKALQLPQYHAPVLIGYGAGASVVYAALANTPAVTFRGGVSLAFCPTLKAAVPICSGDVWFPEYDYRRRTNALPRSPALPKDWYVVQGAADRVCPVDAIRPFVTAVPRAHFSVIDGADRRLKPLAAWLSALDAALQDLWTDKQVGPPSAQPRTATARELEAELQRLQLPLEYRWPAQLSALLLFFSGDGGWASLDEAMAEQLVTHGIGVVGVSSLRYFWNEKTPAEVARDISRVNAILSRSGRPLFAGGFSFGAEIVPVALRQWSAGERRRLAGLVLIAPSLSASFEIDPLDWIRKPAANPATLVAAAVREVGVATLCLAGTDEEETPCVSLNGAPGVRTVRLPGSHHFNSDYAAVAETVAQFIRAVAAEKRP